MVAGAEAGPDPSDVEGWRQAIQEGRLSDIRPEAIVIAVQILGPNTDQRVIGPLMQSLSDRITDRLEFRIGRNKAGRDEMIDAVQIQLLEAVLQPTTKDGQGLREAFRARIDFRAGDALRKDAKERKREPSYDENDKLRRDPKHNNPLWTDEQQRAYVERLLLQQVPDYRKRLAFRLEMEVRYVVTTGDLSQPIQALIDAYRNVIGIIFGPLEQLLSPLLRWLGGLVGWDVELYPHWRHILLLSLVFWLAWARAYWSVDKGKVAAVVLAGIVCSFVGTLGAGTLPLGGANEVLIFILPVATSFLSLDLMLTLTAVVGRVRFLNLWALVVFATLAALVYFLGPSMIAAGPDADWTARSPALLFWRGPRCARRSDLGCSASLAPPGAWRKSAGRGATESRFPCWRDHVGWICWRGDSLRC